ncbi:MAG: HTH-type transcriptional regulator / antitoxin HigA [uncultured Sulfurovum sp.]|uniref:HTH-type transcriptional regulator / antitoxin HigA n=1 Tax=uncultured Sulfurovum sp. TaxID=269237 RepID=A0A6S6T7V1_9BACT|nr:MAG: HTH-type transcriptional regulator / antitoxin HigA [uncultured Sulfurovum sp.]
MTNMYQTDLAIHPGELLEETLEDIGMSQRELANRLGRPVQAINEIIKGKKSITSATALELEDVLSVPSHIWIGLESEYQMVLARQEELKQMKEESSLVRNFPYSDLVKLGLVKTTRKAIEKVDELKRFFGVAKLVQIQHVKIYQPAFRVSNHNNISHEAIATWIQVAIIKAQAIETESFEKKKLKENLPKLKSLMNYNDINQSIKELKQLLNTCGIALILLPHFKNTKVNGATFWLDNNKAVIVMSLRGSFSDVFWFSLFHEIGHIMLHPKREVFLENGYSDPKLEKQETEADDFASQLLILDKDFKDFISIADFSKTHVINFAKKQGIKPSIVVGRLMRYNYINYNDYNLSSLRDRYKWGSK